MSEGAWDMLLHLCRVRPLPEPFPPHSEGRQYLAELLSAGLIERAGTASGFVPTASGFLRALEKMG